MSDENIVIYRLGQLEENLKAWTEDVLKEIKTLGTDQNNMSKVQAVDALRLSQVEERSLKNEEAIQNIKLTMAERLAPGALAGLIVSIITAFVAHWGG